MSLNGRGGPRGGQKPSFAGHCDNKIRGSVGARAEEAQAAGSQAELADKDGRVRGRS